MNVRRLRKIKKHILGEPLRVNMGVYARKRELGYLLPHDHKQRWPECGTVACICGWDTILSGETVIDLAKSIRRLRIPNNWLFYTDYWPQDLREKIEDYEPGTAEYANVVGEAIEDYIKTDGWEIDQ